MAGFGAGKTRAGAAEIIRYAVQNVGYSSLIVVKNIPVARKTVIPTMKDLLTASEIKFKFNAVSFEFYLPEFSHTIYIASSEIPDSLKGSNVTVVWFDEAASMNDEAYKQAIGRCREKCPTGNKIWLTTTPEGLNWLYEEFFLNQKPGREIIHGNSSDNQALPTQYIAMLNDRYTEDEKEMYIHGRFAKSRSGLVIPEFDEVLHVVDALPEDKYYPYYDKYVSIDLGVTDKTVILFGHYNFPKALLHIEEEVVFQGNGMTSLLIANEIKATEERLWGGQQGQILRFSDWNNPLLLQDLSMLHGIYVANAAKDMLEAMVNQTRLFVQADRVQIRRHCRELIANLNLGKWNDKKHRPDFQRSKAYGHLDALAAFLIMVRNVDQFTNPLPGLPPGVHNLRENYAGQSANKYQALEDAFYGT